MGNYEGVEHYHCALCGEIYPTSEGAVQYFWSHTELEILRWVAFELVAAHHFAGNGEDPLCKDEVAFSTEFVKKLNERFRVAEIDENGWVFCKIRDGLLEAIEFEKISNSARRPTFDIGAEQSADISVHFSKMVSSEMADTAKIMPRNE